MSDYEDKRLGECNSYDVQNYITYDNCTSMVISRPCIFQCNTYNRKGAHRKFVRRYRKRKIYPYIKVSILENNTDHVIGVCRLSMYHPKYINGYNENFILNESQINDLIHLLNDEMSVFHYTMWQTIINIYNNDLMMNNLSYRIPKNLKMPDYTQLKDVK